MIPVDHVHSKACDRVAVIVYRKANGEVAEWGVGAGCQDDERSIRAHFAKWHPEGEFLSVKFEQAR